MLAIRLKIIQYDDTWTGLKRNDLDVYGRGRFAIFFYDVTIVTLTYQLPGKVPVNVFLRGMAGNA
jgi:hypothetical protein